MPTDFKPIATRIVSEPMQESFARLSGDYNPMHMDPVAARRTQAGQPVVHGIHTLLWALESLVAAGFLSHRPTRIQARFLKWIYLNDEATLKLTGEEATNPRSLLVEVKGLPVLTLDLTFGDRPELSSSERESSLTPIAKPRELTLADLAELRGEAFVVSAQAAEAAFAALSAFLGPAVVAELTSTSYIVGMEAPGMHSMYSKMDVTLRPDASRAAEGLAYEVVSHDSRFAKARIRVAGAALEGLLEVFVRTPPAPQAAMQEISSLIRANEFAGMRALVIGGSRGLGEVTAKIIAAGGGEVILSYAVGHAEAEEVATQIRAAGAQASTMPYDVRKPAAAQLAALPATPTHLFFFATNAIFQPRYELFSAEVFATFSQFYLLGFYDLCKSLLAVTPNLTVYYPSSIAVEERPADMTEYSMVKAAGELLCDEMNRRLPGIDVAFTRLPRLPTDQTAGVVPERGLSPLATLIPIVQERMNAAHRRLQQPNPPPAGL